MNHRIRRFNIIQTAKVMGVLYALMGLVFIPISILLSIFGLKFGGFGIVMGFVMAIVYGVIGFVFGAIGCWIYNQIASWTGGVEFELVEPGTPAF